MHGRVGSDLLDSEHEESALHRIAFTNNYTTLTEIIFAGIHLIFPATFVIKKDMENILKEMLTQEHDVSASSYRHYQMQIIEVVI